MSWLDPLQPPKGEIVRTLVLCRTATAGNAVRRWIAANGGLLGIDIKTPTALAHSMEANQLWTTQTPVREKDFTFPDKHPWASVAQRPGLAAILTDHINDILVQGLTGEDIPTEIRLLLDAGWTPDADTAALMALVERVEAELGKRPLGYDRVFAIGFGNPANDLPEPPGTTRYFERLLKGLDATRLQAPALCDAVGVQTSLAADVASEAAWVVRKSLDHIHGGGKPDDVMVLFAGADDRDRIAATLARNGVPAAIDQARKLSQHALAVLIKSVLPWFDDQPANKVVLVGETIRKLFQNPLVGQAEYTQSETDELRQKIADLSKKEVKDESLDDSAEEVATDWLNLKRRTVTDALLACHLVRGTLNDWRASLQAVAENAEIKFATRRAALLLEKRLEWLEAKRGPRMGSVREFLNKLHLVTHGDRVGMLIQKALADGGDQSATEDVLDDLLGSAASSGDINLGVTLLAYAQYDGRPSKLCLLTGMHSKGVGQAPAPDPFFTDEIAAGWGRVGGARYVDFLMMQACAAVARSEQAFACVVQRSADGRAVVPVSHQLINLDHDKPTIELRNYGLALKNPENDNHEALEVIAQAVPVSGPATCGNVAADHAALMASVEWARNGGTFESVQARPAGETDKTSNLKDFLDTFWTPAPDSIRPYMGGDGSVAAAKLERDAVLSVSTAFEPMSHCLFQAFLKTKLRLREAEDLEEELNAKEVGTAVHAAMEELGTDPRWRPATEAEVEGAVAGLFEKLAEATERHLNDTVKNLPKATAALESARKGLADRWKNHLKMYVRDRVRSQQALKEEVPRRCKELIESFDAFKAAMPTASIMEVDGHRKHAREWFHKALNVSIDGGDPLADEMFDHCNGKSIVVVKAWAQQESVQQQLRIIADDASDFIHTLRGTAGQVCGGAPEWKFGLFTNDEKTQPLKILLGTEADVHIHGSIDLVRYLLGDDGAFAVEIIDYKTGKAFAKGKDVVSSGTKPQLPVYALALQEARRQGLGPKDDPVNTGTPTLAYDFIKDLDTSGLYSWQPGISGPSLQETAQLLGHLVGLLRKGEYPVIPHTLTCPELNTFGHDYCPFGPVCRFHAHPGTDGVTDYESGEGAEG